MLGATDRRLKAVVAQVPTISGYEQSLRRVAPDQVATLEASFIDDDGRQFAGEAPARNGSSGGNERLWPICWMAKCMTSRSKHCIAGIGVEAASGLAAEQSGRLVRRHRCGPCKAPPEREMGNTQILAGRHWLTATGCPSAFRPMVP